MFARSDRRRSSWSFIARPRRWRREGIRHGDKPEPEALPFAGVTMECDCAVHLRRPGERQGLSTDDGREPAWLGCVERVAEQDARS